MLLKTIGVLLEKLLELYLIQYYMMLHIFESQEVEKNLNYQTHMHKNECFVF